MLISLALSLAPLATPALAAPLVPASAQGGAELHPADAGLYIEVPDLPAFLRAWQSGAIKSFLDDQELSGLFNAFGLEGVDDVLAFLPPDLARDVLPILEGVEGISMSAQVDMSSLGEVVAEGAVVFEVLGDLSDLDSRSYGYAMENGTQATSAEQLGLSAAELADPFGGTYRMTVERGRTLWTCLGSDGAPGGAGLAADWSSGVEFPAYVAARVSELVGMQLVVEWVDGDLADAMADQLAMIDGRLRGELPFSEVLDLNGEGRELATLYRMDPASVGLPATGKPFEASLQRHGNSLLMTMGTISGERVHALGLHAATGVASPDSLAGSGRLDELLAGVHSDEGELFWQGAVLGFPGVPAEDELAGPLDGLTTLLGFLGFHGSGSAWQTRLVDGSYVGNSVRPADGQRPAALHQAASWVPNDAIFAQVTTMDPSGLWTYVQDVAEGEEQLIDMLLERGLDVEADLFGNLGRELTLWVQPVRSLAPPQLYGVVPVRDGEALMRVMDGLCDFIAELQGDLAVSHRPYRGSTYTVLDLGIPIGFSPSYTVLDGNLWFSNSSTLIKRTIRQVQKGEDYERGAHPLFAGLQGEDGRLADDVQSAFYFDAGSLLAAYYSTGRAFAGMIPPDMGLPPDLASSLPEPAIFERHFRPETSVTRLVGGQLHTHRVSSLGPEVPLLGLVAGAGLGFMQASGPVPAPGSGGFEFGSADSAPLGYGGGGPTPPAPVRAEPSGEAMLTSINLQLVDLALLIYSIENGDYPASLDELVEATPAYPEGYLQSAEVPLDGWGRALHYARTGAGVYELYSLGPNGQDDGGAGDDLGTDD